MEKDKVITELLRRIANLEYEVERQDNILEQVEGYVDKMLKKQDNEIERLNKELEELKHIMYIIRDDNGLNHLWCKDIILKWLKGDDKE